MKLVTKIFWLTVCVGIGLLCIRQGRVYSGYCPATGNYPSDDERFQAALMFQLPMSPPSITIVPYRGARAQYFHAINSPAYESASSFHQAYPNCCSMVDRGSEGWHPSTFDRITGHTFGIVAVTHEAAYLDGGQLRRTLTTNFVPISACGQPHSSND
jgi:hypothetical protein